MINIEENSRQNVQLEIPQEFSLFSKTVILGNCEARDIKFLKALLAFSKVHSDLKQFVESKHSFKFPLSVIFIEELAMIINSIAN